MCAQMQWAASLVCRIKQCCYFFCLFHAPSSTVMHFRALVSVAIRSVVIKSDQNSHEAVTGATSETFAGWLHH